MQEMSDMPKGHRTIEVQASCILAFSDPGCTICLIGADDKDRWYKVYRSTREAFQEARILKLPGSILSRLASSNEPAPICVVDLAKIVELEFHNGEKRLATPVHGVQQPRGR